MEESRGISAFLCRISQVGRGRFSKKMLSIKSCIGGFLSGVQSVIFLGKSCNQLFCHRRIYPTVLAQLVTTTTVVLAVNYGLETFIHENLFATLVCGIIAVALICVVCVCCALRLATTWPWCIVYLILPSLSFGIIFGVICVVYAEGDSFLVIFLNDSRFRALLDMGLLHSSSPFKVAAGFSCGLFLAINLAFYWLATGVYFVNPNGWLIRCESKLENRRAFLC